MPDIDYDLSVLLMNVAQRGGSDVHLMHGIPPIARIAGALGVLPYKPLTSDIIQELLNPYISEIQRGIFQKENRVNCGHTIGESRYRFNIYMSLGTVGASIRILPQKTYPLSSLGLPPVVGTLAYRKSGIIFITGATGSGKSKTMAAIPSLCSARWASIPRLSRWGSWTLSARTRTCSASANCGTKNLFSPP